MKASIQQRIAKRKRQIERRLSRKVVEERESPVFEGGGATYELAERTRGVNVGGISLIHLLAKKSGLVEAIDRRLHLLCFHLPYHESDHVLNIAYNALCGGTCLDDIELRRNDEVFLDALGADRIPDPTTAGDFCRRFSEEAIFELQYAFDEVRLNVWRRQPDEFFHQAVLDMDGTMVETTGECKEGMGLSYKGTWGYHPLLVTLANTGEPLRLVNRSGNRPSHEGAWAVADDAIDLCRRAGFRNILLRGDTDFTQTEHLDRWTEEKVEFVFGVDAMPNLKAIADDLPEEKWTELQRRRKPRWGKRRRRPEKIKERIVVERGYKNRRLVGEDFAEFTYRPTKCRLSYRVIVLRKHIEETGGQTSLFPGLHDRYFFYITNTRLSARQVIREANLRCNQENILAQLKNGVRSLHAPVDNLVSNWAYMVMSSLAWSLKAWFALWMPEPASPARGEERRAEKRLVLRMEFKTFLNYFMRLPAQVVQTGRRLVIRLLSWNRWQPFFFQVNAALRQ